MGKRTSRKGSLAFWHRARANRIIPRVRSWPLEQAGPLGFPAFKAGIAHGVVVEDSASPLKGQEVVWPLTVLAAPPIFVYAITLWEKTPLGLKALAQISSKSQPKQLKRALTPVKKEKSLEQELKKFHGRTVQVRLLCCTQPWKIGLKHKPDVFEIALGGNVEAQSSSATNLLGKEIHAKDVLADGEFVDALAVTKGKGWQGVVKRHGAAINIRKSTQSRRHGGSIGPERQAKVMYTVPRAGQMGFHKRTDRSKRVVKVSDDFKSLGEFSNYGVVKSTFIIVKGSVPGPAKRFVFLRKQLYQHAKSRTVEVKQ